MGLFLLHKHSPNQKPWWWIHLQGWEKSKPSPSADNCQSATARCCHYANQTPDPTRMRRDRTIQDLPSAIVLKITRPLPPRVARIRYRCTISNTFLVKQLKRPRSRLGWYARQWRCCGDPGLFFRFWIWLRVQLSGCLPLLLHLIKMIILLRIGDWYRLSRLGNKQIWFESITQTEWINQVLTSIWLRLF